MKLFDFFKEKKHKPEYAFPEDFSFEETEMAFAIAWGERESDTASTDVLSIEEVRQQKMDLLKKTNCATEREFVEKFRIKHH